MTPDDEGPSGVELASLRGENAELKEALAQAGARLERVRTLVDLAADAVLLHDGQGRIIDANRTAWIATGYTREEYLQLNIRDIDQAVAAIPLQRYGDNWARMTPGTTVHVESVHRAKDGRRFPVEIRVTPIEEGGERLYVATMRDISDLKRVEAARTAAEHERQEVLDRLEERVSERTRQLSDINARLRSEIRERERAEVALNDAKVAAEEANQAKSQFLASMSHELRTPLNAVIGYAEMLQEDAHDIGHPELVADLEKIRGAGRHLLGIINDILDLSKVEAGKLELSIEDVQVEPLIADVVSTIQPLAEANGNQLAVHVAGELGTARTDVTRVRQILFNLLSNACKFTQNGTVTLTAVRETVEGREHMLFTIVDDGIGIREEQLERLFTPFTQADASTTRRYGGTGLGLSISERLCRMLGGEMEVASTYGEGSSFSVSLPLRTPYRSSARPPAPTPDPSRPLVLVVDDDESAQDLLARMLEKDGYRVVCAGSGGEALELARVERPQVITLDVIMPSMDGWAVLSALKSDAALRDVPVVLVTVVHDRQLGYSLGAADFLSKPVDRAALLRTVGRHRSAVPARSVLVVDDDPEARSLARRALQRDAWEVVEADDGRAALEQMRRQRPGVVLLDLLMPEVDGFAVLEAMQGEPALAEVPVIVVTGADLTPEERELLSRRTSHVMQKGQRDQDSLLEQVRERVAACLSPRP